MSHNGKLKCPKCRNTDNFFITELYSLHGSIEVRSGEIVDKAYDPGDAFFKGIQVKCLCCAHNFKPRHNCNYDEYPENFRKHLGSPSEELTGRNGECSNDV